MGSRVLLADDSVTIQKVVKIIFANEDCELEIVGNGDAALQKAREIMPQVMLVDALMPIKNGYEVCQEIRRDPALKHISLLLMTGAFDPVDEEKKKQSGADEFITKPFESQSLLDVTARLVALSIERASQAPPMAVAPVAAAPAFTQPVPAAPVAVPAAPVEDDIWGEFSTGFDQEVTEAAPEPFTPPMAPVAPPAPAPASADDDLWGVFDMDVVELGSTEPPAAARNESYAETVANDDFFDFGGEEPAAAAPAPYMEEFVLEEVAEVEPVVEEPREAAAGYDAFGDFDLEPTAPEPIAPPVMERAPIPFEEDFSTISFDEPEPVAPVAPPVARALPVVPEAPAPVFEAPAAAPVFAAPPLAPVAPPVAQTAPQMAEPVTAPPAPAAPPVTSTVAAAVSLDEEQLKALLSKVSRDVIERIVWEIVPDLAESIIMEEIRKLKAGIQG